MNLYTANPYGTGVSQEPTEQGTFIVAADGSALEFLAIVSSSAIRVRPLGSKRTIVITASSINAAIK